MSHVVIEYLSQYLPLIEEERKKIISILHFRRANKNQELISSGEVCDKIIFITKGAVRIYSYNAKGDELTHLFVFENQFLTDPNSFFGQVPSEFSADTMEDTEFYWTSFAEFTSLLETLPKLEKAVRSILVAQMPWEKDALKYQREASAKEKYDGLVNTHPEIVARIPLKYIASYLGIALETLSRVRGKK